MKTVWKYTLDEKDDITINLPLGAEILSVQEQHGEPQMWVLVDPNEVVIEQRVFRLAGTGHPIKKSVKFIGTFQLFGGSFVGHLFEVIE